jgi:peptide/nickel transport system permease protein
MSYSPPAGGPGLAIDAGSTDFAQTEIAPGLGPYRIAWRRLRRNKVALAFGGLFLIIVVICLLAPVYSQDIAHIGPDDTSQSFNVTNAIGIPIGPTWNPGHFFLGADTNGRDEAVRLLYGGRNSLLIGVVAMLITIILATILGTVAGYFRGPIDGLLSRFFELLWAYPAILLGIALGTSLQVGGISFGLFTLQGSSLMVPAIIIGVVYIPYVAKPIRAQVLTLREREFVDAARQQGLGPARIMFGEILPNLSSTIIVFVPLILANAILLEAALSYLGAGVQAPNASWGTMISDGIRLIPAAIHLTLAPGIMLVLTVLGINVFGDGVRDALDPRSQVKVRRPKDDAAGFDPDPDFGDAEPDPASELAIEGRAEPH